ncbi:MAG TPA: PAS domain S-box protein [Bacteroidota bacterium]|nr:PAS domain S-box protein [Bacteroidota bacterium]
MERAHILIVEDELIVAKGIESDLKSYGYMIDGIARSSTAALEAVAASHPDVILMDIKLSGQMDGIEVAEHVMRCNDIPVIFISAYSDEATLQRAKEITPYGYLLKPFESKELYTTIEMALYKHRMERRLKDSERRLRLITDSMLDMVSEVDREGMFTYLSPSHKQVLGYEDEELMHHPVETLFHPEDVERVRGRLEQAFAEEHDHITLEIRLRHKAGHYLWLEANCSRMLDASGGLIGAVIGSRDITAKHEVEERMHRSQAQLSSLIGSAMDAIIITDEERKIVLFNASAESIFKCTAAEAIGHTINRFIPPALREKHDSYIRSFAAVGEEYRRFTGMMTKARAIRATGEEFPFEATVSKTVTDGKRYFTVILRDVTEHKRAEDALRASEERYRLVVTQMPAQLWTTDLHLHFTSTQGIGFHTIGVEPNQLDGLAIQQFFNTSDPLYAPIAAHRRALAGESLNYEVTINGHTFEGHVEPLRNAQQVIIGTLGVAFDITERKFAEEELQRERNLLRTIIEAIPDEVYVKDRNCRMILANRTALRQCGVATVDEILGKTDVDLFGTPIAEQHLRDEQKLIATGVPMLNVENNRYHPETGFLQRSILISKYPLRDVQGGIIGLVGINRDNTARRRSIEQIRRANLVIENTDTVIFIWRHSPDLAVEYVSNNISIFGYTQSELIGGAISFLSIIHPKDAPMVLEPAAGHTKSRSYHLKGDFRIICKNGETRWVSSRTNTVRNSHGDVTHYEGLLEDITERKRTEHSLQLTQFSVDHASDSVFWISNTGTFVYVNRAACRQLGYTSEELRALSIPDIDTQLTTAKLWSLWHACEAAGDAALNFDTIHRSKTGEEIPVEVTINRMEFGDVEYFFASVRNIKKRKEAEEALRTSVTNALKFSTLAAHELRTPLAVIRHQLEETLTQGTPAKKLRETITTVYDEMLNLSNIVADLLNLSKMQAGNFELRSERIALHTLIQEFYDEALFLSRPKDITIVLKKFPKAFINADVPRLRQVLFNLLDNALKHTPPHRQIRFGYTITETAARLYFEDTGEGIVPEKLARIFDPYYRAGEDLDKSDGIGLGLTLVKWIVELHHGTISVESIPDKGTSFFITLPLDLTAPLASPASQ